MNKITTNKDFIKIFQLIEQINKECSLKLGLNTQTYLSINEWGSLSVYLIVKYKGHFHSFEFNIHQMEMRAAKYIISDQLSNLIFIAVRELRKKIEEDLHPSGLKELKDTDLITVCSKCSRASCWNGEFMCQESLTAGTAEKTVAELKELGYENSDNWKK